MAIAFGAAGTQGAAASGTSIAPALPAGIAVGNLMVGLVSTKNNATHTWPAGWTKVNQTNSGASYTTSWAWKIFQAGDTAPSVTWAGSVANTGQIWSYTGQDTFNPIGAVGTVATGTVSPHTSTAITTTHSNSLAIYIDSCSANTVLTQPTGYTQNFGTGSATSVTALASGSMAVASVGTSTGAISTAGGAAAWTQVQVEINVLVPPDPNKLIRPHQRSLPDRGPEPLLQQSPFPNLVLLAPRPSPFRQIDWPTPVAPYRIDQTWTWSYNLNLIGKDVLPTGNQRYDLAPIYPPYVNQLRTWTWNYNLNLIGKDKLPTGKQVYDLAPGQRVPDQIQLRSWQASYNLNLIGKDQLPTGQQLWELTPRQLRNQDVINWVQAVNLALTVIPAVLPPGINVYDRPPVPVFFDLYTRMPAPVFPPFIPPSPPGPGALFTVSGPDVACNFGVSGPPYTRFGYSNVVYPQSPLSLRTK
jgi:hypothetical protein